MASGSRVARFLRRVDAALAGDATPANRNGRGFQGFKPLEDDGGMWARCGVCGDLERVRTESARHAIEKGHWDREHAG